MPRGIGEIEANRDFIHIVPNQQFGVFTQKEPIRVQGNGFSRPLEQLQYFAKYGNQEGFTAADAHNRT
jgi:hypothetical protein